MPTGHFAFAFALCCMGQHCVRESLLVVLGLRFVWLGNPHLFLASAALWSLVIGNAVCMSYLNVAYAVPVASSGFSRCAANIGEG